MKIFSLVIPDTLRFKYPPSTSRQPPKELGPSIVVSRDGKRVDPDKTTVMVPEVPKPNDT